MEESSDLLFRRALQKALDEHYPEWAIRHNYQSGQDPPLGVWPDTLWGWINGKHIPQLKRFRYFVTENEFPEETRTELLELHRKSTSERKKPLTLSPQPEQVPINGEGTLKMGEHQIPNNLPIQDTPFVKVSQLDSILERLKDSNCRLLTLRGPHGAGKTRLAIAAASALIDAGDQFVDGVFFVPLIYVDDPNLIVSRIADSIGFGFKEDLEQKGQLFRHLNGKDKLLILDNFENLIGLGGVEFLIEFFKEVSDLKVLVTSRESLKIKMEYSISVEGMQAPQAIELFANSATRVDADFIVSESDKHFIGEICKAISGLPLGIELAATWVDTLDCGKIAKEIQEKMDFLENNMTDVPAHHHSLRAAFEQSWAPLPPSQKDVFSRLCIFHGQFSLMATEQVASASPSDLRSLVNRSLVRRKISGYFEILESLRRYGEEKLNDQPDKRKEMQERHCTYYSNFLKAHQSAIEEDARVEVLLPLLEEYENIHLAWNWAVKQGHEEQIAKCMLSLNIFYDVQGRYAEGESAFRQAVEELESCNTQNEAIKLRCLRYANKFCLLLGYNDKVVRNCEGYLSNSSLNQTADVGVLYSQLGRVYYEEGKYSLAREQFEKSLTILKLTNEYTEIATEIMRLADIAGATGDKELAGKYLQEAFEIYKKIKDERGIRQYLANLGDLKRKEGDFEGAQKIFKDLLEIIRERDSQLWIGICLVHLGILHGIFRRYEEGKIHCRKSLEIFEKLEGRTWQVQFAKNQLGKILYLNGEYNPAIEILEENMTGINQPYHETVGRTWLGYTYQSLENHTKAKENFARVLALGQGELEPEALEAIVGISKLLIEQVDIEEAVELLTHVTNNGKTEAETKKRAENLLEKLKDEANPRIVGIGQSRGKELNFEEIVQLIMDNIL